MQAKIGPRRGGITNPARYSPVSLIPGSTRRHACTGWRSRHWPIQAVDNKQQDRDTTSTKHTDSDSRPHSAQTKDSPHSLLSSMRNWRNWKNFKVMGLEPTPELVAISMVYFVQGILGLSRLALSFFYKDELHLDPAEVALLTGLAGLPWMIKPLYGFISDSVPLWGYKRRSYLVLAGLTGACSWVALCTVVRDPTTAAIAMLLASLSTASSDVLVDSLVVERARNAPQEVAGSLQSLCWGSSAVGGIVSAYWSGFLVESFGTKFVFGITALFPLVVSCSAMLINEKRIGAKERLDSVEEMVTLEAGHGESAPLLGHPAHHKSALRERTLSRAPSHSHAGSDGTATTNGLNSAGNSQGGGVGRGSDGIPVHASSTGGAGSTVVVGNASVGQQLLARGKTLWAAISRKDILLPTLFVFCWQATPSADTAMFYFQTNELHFQPEFLGRVRLVGSLASLAGVLLYNTCLKQVPIRTLLWWAMILGVTLGSTQLILVSRVNLTLGLSDQLFVLGDAALLTALGQASFMPILVLAARLCPQGVEATLFATLMSVLNAGSFTGSGLGAAATKLLGVTSDDFTNLFTLVAFCNVCQLLPAPLLSLIPESLGAAEDDDSKPGSGGNGSKSAQASGQNGQDNNGAHVIDMEMQGSTATAVQGSKTRHRLGSTGGVADTQDEDSLPMMAHVINTRPGEGIDMPNQVEHLPLNHPHRQVPGHQTGPKDN